MAANNNPNILDVLFCRDSEVRLITAPGKVIRKHAQDFLSTKCRFTFHGYALGQLKRIELHRGYLLNPPDHKPEREEFGLHKNSDLPKNQIDAAFAAVRKKIDSWRSYVDKNFNWDSFRDTSVFSELKPLLSEKMVKELDPYSFDKTKTQTIHLRSPIGRDDLKMRLLDEITSIEKEKWKLL